MKPDSNMETDRLLQKLARRRRGLLGRETDQVLYTADDAPRKDTSVVDHLDADEMIAFAENALPAAARTRYAGHLAECEPCRKLVTKLVLSSGVNIKSEPLVAAVPQTSSRSWRDWIKPIFAPSVLRYAAPVVLLVGISAIAFMIYRDREVRFETSSTRQSNESANEKGTVYTTSNGNQTLNEGTAENGSQPKGKSDSKPGAEVASAESQNARQDGLVEGSKPGQEQPGANQSAPVTTGVLADKGTGERDKDTKTMQRAQPTFAEDTLSKSESTKEVEREESQGRVASERANRDEAAKQKAAGGANVTESKSAPAPRETTVARKRAKTDAEPSPAAVASETTDDNRKSQGTGTGASEGYRTISGKQFARRNGTWIDVAYRSQGTTGVRRGSDQYRALVADEPGLRAFASQLDGEVIVVWKGRAYRFY